MNQNDFQPGDIVRYQPNWCCANERDETMTVLEWWPDVNRGLILHHESNVCFQVTETVTGEHIQLVQRATR